jgi:hypothetical protein
LSFEANLTREREGTRMTTICVSQEIIASLENLDKPLDLCDESGRLLGSFIPEMAMQEMRPIAEAEGDLRAGRFRLRGGPGMTGGAGTGQAVLSSDRRSARRPDRVPSSALSAWTTRLRSLAARRYDGHGE